MIKIELAKKSSFFIIVLLFFCVAQLFGAICGDANDDQEVDIVDALVIAQYYVGLTPSISDPSTFDVNNDNSIDIVDSLLIAQFYVGLITELQCGNIQQETEPLWTGGPYTLDGSSEYIDMPDGLTSNLNDFTISSWVYLYSRDTWTRIFDFGGNSDIFMMMTPESGTTGFPYFCITTNGNDGEQGINGTSEFPTNQWQHIAVVKSGSTGILYINSQEVGRNNSISLSPSDLGSTSNNYIGRSQWAQDPYLNAAIDEFKVYGTALSASQVAELGSNPPPIITPAPTPTPGAINKIMPLGDSITHGTQIPGGYRIKLWSNIRSLGRSIDFVGSSVNGPAELGDKDHEGHPGWRIDQIDANINSWMDSYSPEIVLLHIGTNDVIQNYNFSGAIGRLNTLIDKICAKLPANGKLYVAQLIPLSNSGQNQMVINFNNQIPGIVQNKVSQGKPVYLVNMYRALSTSDLLDGVHPTRGGYDKMADVWFQAIRDNL